MLPGFDGVGARIRLTAEAEIAVVMPWLTAQAARSGQFHLDGGAPVWAGGWQARALISATCTGVNLGGRPLRRRSVEHNPDTDDLPAGSGLGVSQLRQAAPLGGGQHDLACGGNRHGRERSSESIFKIDLAIMPPKTPMPGE